MKCQVFFFPHRFWVGPPGKSIASLLDLWVEAHKHTYTHTHTHTHSREAPKLRIEGEKALVAAQLATAPKRVQKRLERIGCGETGSWLTVVPERRNDTLLSMEEMRDNLRLRYGVRPIGLSDRCGAAAESSRWTTH